MRKVTFWDTTFDKIDWKLHKVFVINRILSYGNIDELVEIERFYGKEIVEKIKLLNHQF